MEIIEFVDFLIYLNFKFIIYVKLLIISFVCFNVNLYLFSDLYVSLFFVF